MRDIDFCELLRRGEITRLPRLFAVQPENCAPLHATFLTGGAELVVIEYNPPSRKALRSRSRCARARDSRRAPSGGRAVVVSQRGIEAALGELARTGLKLS